MPAKITFISLVHSVTERDSTNYTIREATVVVRNEDNSTMDVKVTSFTPKDKSAPRWIPLFERGNVLRFTGKFAIENELPHSTLEVIIFFFFFLTKKIYIRIFLI